MTHSRRTILVLTALALSARAGAVDFSLQTAGTFPSVSTPSVHVNGRGFSYLHFRLYRIDEPEAFFRDGPKPDALARPAASSPVPAAPEAAAEESSAEGGGDIAQGVLKNGRETLPPRLKRAVREWLGVAWVPPFKRGRTPASAAPLAGLPLVSAWTRDFSASAWGWVYQQVPVPLPGPGVYLLEAVNGADAARVPIIAGDLSFEVKRSSGEALVYCADASGRPVAGASVWSLQAGDKGWGGGKVVDSGKTGPDGLWKGKAEDPGLFLARKGRHFSAARARGPWQSDPKAKVYLYTDRPVYRPGHTVRFKGIARTFDGTEYRTTAKPVELEIRDVKGGVLLKKTLAPNAYGSFAGELALPEEASLGRYVVTARAEGAAESSFFEVQAYRKPEFKVVVQAGSPRALLGDELSFDIRADYFFGAPASGADVEYTLYRVPTWTWRPYDAEDEDGESYAYDYGGQAVERGAGKLDAGGRLVLRLKARPGDEDARRWWTPDYKFRLVANVTDASQRTNTGVAAVLATRAESYVLLRPDRYVYSAGEPFSVAVAVLGYDKKPVETELELTAVAIDRGDRGAQTTADARLFLQLPKGGAEWPLKLERPGSYRLDAKGKDAQGREIKASEYVWVAGKGEGAPVRRPGKLLVIPDRRDYRPGQTARLLVHSPVKAAVLLSIEGAKVHKTMLLKPSDGPVLVQLRVPEAWAPNVFLSATALAGGEVRRAVRRLSVSPEKSLLKVSVQADRPALGPDQDVTFTVTAKDRLGRPVDAEVSLGVVDEAVYALVPELAPDIKDFFYAPRPNRVATSFSKDFWMRGHSRPGVSTELAPDDAFEAEDLKAGTVEPKVRRRFEDTMTWVAMLPTGPAGTAVFRAHTPDNLTTWRMTTRAVTPATAVGQATGTFLTKKDLLVRLEPPRFYTRGDEAVLTAVVHNNLASAKDVKVELQLASAGGRLVPAAPLSPIVRRVPSQGQESFKWTLKAVQAGKVKLLVKALTDQESDAVELEVPIHEHGFERLTAVTGESKDRSTAELQFPTTADAETAKFVVNLTPNPGSALLQALPSLMEYPYGCVEQTMSRFGPTVAAARAFRELKLPTEGLPKDLDKMVAAGVKRLTGFQHADGGWGWWENDETHPFMSAYALWGLVQARGEGFPVDPGVIQRGMTSVLGQLSASIAGGKDEDVGSSFGAGKGGPKIRAFMLYVLSQMPEAAAAVGPLADKVALEAPKMQPQSKALLALAMKSLGRSEAGLAYAGDLEAAAQLTSGVARWEGKSFDHGWHEDTVQTTAAALRAVVNLKPKSTVAPAAMRGLLLGRKGGSWRSTLDTAAVVYSLVDYAKAAPGADPEMTARVLLNGKEVASRKLERGSAGDTKIVVERPAVRPGPNVVEIVKEGKGELFYTAALSYYEKGEDLKPEDGAFKVRRRYRRLVPKRLAEGTPGYGLEEPKDLRPGDAVLVELEAETPAEREFVMLEDPLPSGFEVTDALDEAQIEGLDRGWKGGFTSREVKDDRVALFFSELGAGRHVWRYIARAEQAGKLHVMPAVIQMTYSPEQRGSSEESRLDIH